MEFERPSEPGTYGIVTAVSSNLLPEFVCWYESLRRIGNYRITVVDLGLTDAERPLLYSKPVRIIRPDTTFYSTIDRAWGKWYKPAFFGMADYDFRLWLDVDIIVAKPLEPIFAVMQRKPFLTNDHFAPKACLNRPGLYEKFPADGHDAPLNSGVVGFRFPRDQRLLERWLANVYTCHTDMAVRRLVTLHDQGCLLWAVRHDGLINDIESDRQWNWPAKRNLYERGSQGQWPTPNVPRMGGDTINNVILDNPEATVIHFAGEPKLPVLCSVNHPRARVGQFAHKFGTPTRVFGVGLERAGTHTLAEALRRSCKASCWVRHEFEPCLAEEAKAKAEGRDYLTPALAERLELYGRTDCALVADVNHRLAWFVDDIHTRYPDAKFVLLLREPLDLLRSRLLNFCCWSDELALCPGHYQQEVLNRDKHLSPQNLFRLKPPLAFDIIDWHVWEITATAQRLLATFADIPPQQRFICWTHDLRVETTNLIGFVGKQLLVRQRLQESLSQQFGAQLGGQNRDVLSWVDDLLLTRGSGIRRHLGRLFRQFGAGSKAPVL